LPPKPGVGLIVARTGVPVLPVYVTGTDEAMPRGSWWVRPRRVTVRIGPPLRFQPPAPGSNGDAAENGELDKAYYKEIGRAVMDAIDRLRQQSVEGSTG
ncbi:MAG TPA: lysophospholipid acyltransferase family protein, partial [Nitrospiria bacterium]|nr:lysophospholipid acyltransferase family protein [Nitrospiria bacterium]